MNRTPFSPALPARSLLHCLLAFLPLLAGCGTEKNPPALPAEHAFPIALDDRTVSLELALTPKERARGLMYREELAEDAGMLFVFPRPRRMGFYMKNTPLPLDIGYFSPSGVLREVYALHPFDENTVRSRSDRIQFVLEMNQGWFAANGIRRGARLDLEDVADAIRQRGFSPEEFGL